MSRPKDPEQLRFIAEQARGRARRALLHYFNVVFEHVGGRVGSDCAGEIEGIVDDVIEAAECTALAEMIEAQPEEVADVDAQRDQETGPANQVSHAKIDRTPTPTLSRSRHHPVDRRDDWCSWRPCPISEGRSAGQREAAGGREGPGVHPEERGTCGGAGVARGGGDRHRDRVHDAVVLERFGRRCDRLDDHGSARGLRIPLGELPADPVRQSRGEAQGARPVS